MASPQMAPAAVTTISNSAVCPCSVQREAGPKAGQHAGQRPVRQGQRRHYEQHQVRTGAAGKRDPVRDGQLENDRDRGHQEGNQPAHVSACPRQTAWRKSPGMREER
jgi:hypothetical protein